MARVTGRLDRSDLARVFARLLFVQASLHRRGMQSIGLLHALEAVAPKVSDEPGDLLSRHTEYFNTNPHAAPLVVGGILRIEEEGSKSGPASVSRFKHTSASALAAVGDVLFVGALKPLALTLAVVSAIYSFFAGLALAFVLYNAAVLVARYRGLAFGYARGWGVVEAFTGPRVQRVVGAARSLAAFAGGVLVGVISLRALDEGAIAFAWLVVATVAAAFAAKRSIALAWLVAFLFPLSWVVAMLAK
jgi:PTS system mannose-specific IID component